MIIKMGSGFLNIFFDVRNSLFGYVTNANIPNYTSMQCSSIHKNCKYIIVFKIRQWCQLYSNNDFEKEKIDVPCKAANPDLESLFRD